MSTTTPTRPYGLPTELPDPPQPPEGHRGVYRGRKWNNNGELANYVTFGLGIGWQSVIMGKIPEAKESLIYVEYIPLRPTPEGVEAVPEGWEYHSLGGLDDATSPVTEPKFRFFRDANGNRWKMPVDGKKGWIIPKGCNEWTTSSCTITDIENPSSRERDGTIETDADGNPLPLVDTSAENPVNPEPNVVAENPVTEQPASAKSVHLADLMRLEEEDKKKKQPAKAREWVLITDRNGLVEDYERFHGADMEANSRVHVREVRADEAGLLEEAIRLRDEAVGHLCRVVYDDHGMFEAAEWLFTNFPAPAPEPAFDLEKLWSALPPWANWMAMDEDGEWAAFNGEPKCLTQPFARNWSEMSEYTMLIPPEFAPPPAADWKLSLVQRPTATPAQP